MIKRSKESLSVTHPILCKEWDYEKNAPKKPTDVSSGSSEKVWWKCSKGHEWQAVIYSRSSGNCGCPYCSNKRILAGYNDLATLNPDLAKEWNYAKNKNLQPTEIALNYNKKVWWVCNKGHEWEAAPNTRKISGCPYCSNRAVLSGYNDLATTNPDLVKEWNRDKNTLTPEGVTAGSQKKVWWKCHTCGHEWQAIISNRVRKTGCPVCGKAKQLESFATNVLAARGSLRETCPDLISEWDYEKNVPLTPNDVTKGTRTKVWWKCRDCGKGWQASIANRSKGRNCPYCQPFKVSKTRRKHSIAQKGTLSGKYPEIAAQWDYVKNENLTPDQVPSSTSMKVWWRCDRGHTWKTSIYQRVHGSGCPICSNLGSSMPEQGIAYYLAPCCTIYQRFLICNKEVDVFLPDYNIAIEYDGIFYHKEKKQQDKEKNRVLDAAGITLIRIVESDHNEVLVNSIFFMTDNMGTNYVWALEQLFSLLSQFTNNTDFKSIKVDIENDRLKIRERFDRIIKENSLLAKRPDIASEWNYDRNESLTPAIFAVGAGIKVWWKCAQGHEWQATIGNRTSQNSKCPYCSNKKLLIGYNDLKTKCPDIAAEWDYEKNTSISPETVTPASTLGVWWKCERGHGWKAPINARYYGTGCPYCSGRYAIKGETDLETLKPELINEWDYEKNASLKPSDFTVHSSKKVWWKCSAGHEWQAIISNRSKEHGCPYCSGLKAVIGVNDLLTTNPELVKEWDYEKNAPQTPQDYTSKSGCKVWWKDSYGHSWQAAISHRQKGTGCPYCAGQKILKGFNDLASQKPEIAKEWNYEKNAGLKNGFGEDISSPDKVAISSGIKVWWKCSKGHEWQAAPCTRMRSGCPICSGSNFPKAVLCIETGTIYKSMADAQAQTGILRTTIGQCCNGKVKSAGGYHWKYVDE